MNLVDAQQARRILDRLVGYMISPLLWKKVKRGLSAGRVQSVALRIICDREKEIDSFIPKEYWTLDVLTEVDGAKKPMTARFYGKGSQKIQLESRQQVEQIEKELQGAPFHVQSIRRSSRIRKAPNAFTTSTLQQEASRRLNFSTQKTMRLAQQLYEGVDVKGRGTVGLITYLRTDSTRISEEAAKNAGAFIAENYGERYAQVQEKKAAGGKHIQDAHEAIRPTYLDLPPADIKESLSRDQFRLYQLIWNRFLASRMNDAVMGTVNVRIEAAGYVFTASNTKVDFDGFMAVYKTEDDKKETNPAAAKVTENSLIHFDSFDAEQHFTQPPAHFTEASLVRTLEELGIGRPSTYAPTITTILARHYVVKDQKNIYVTELGEVVNNIMNQSFPGIVNVDFTAAMESLLDEVAEGRIDYKSVIRNFYPDLEESVKKAEEELEHVEIEDEVSDVPCEKCGRMMVIKYGPHGKFLACPGFPECHNTKTYYEKIGVSCPECGKDIVIRKTKKGRRYYGCIDNPACSFMTWQRPSSYRCPKCGKIMLYRGNRLACIDAACGYVMDDPDVEMKQA